MLVRKGECHQCGECCQSVNMTVVRDVTLRQHGSLDELKRYMQFRGIRVVGEDIENNHLFYTLDVPCSEWSDEAGCRVHGTPEKPLLCLKYPTQPDGIEACGYRFEEESIFPESGR
ncbi:MAG: hypothetical protein G3M78_15180 [Candidatus Nitrohelix vancouverensis]|uniref:YkgJ family cysteine cluster protein n=1 Tax=Candidatus Nitrohelix vancouverensis TaxID=2705534 RepID=A0A7T0C524_9BACT|nr:MAG: hypothetical protein G3M78_15180 [Candidatus Nitrohelix vancouverensis]